MCICHANLPRNMDLYLQMQPRGTTGTAVLSIWESGPLLLELLSLSLRLVRLVTSDPSGALRLTTEDMSRSHKSKAVSVPVYLSEETHFDVVLGRSFFDCRQIKTSTVDPTEVICLDTGEKIECELVVLKDGRGEIVLVT